MNMITFYNIHMYIFMLVKKQSFLVLKKKTKIQLKTYLQRIWEF